jgi:hypothetical protein
MSDSSKQRTCGHAFPQVFIYPDHVGVPPFREAYSARLEFFEARLRQTPHYTADGECADLFLVKNFLGSLRSSEWVLQLFHRIATEYPHWNRTESATRRREGSPSSAPPIRHYILSPCDHGPGDCMYSRDERKERRGGAVPWEAINPASPTRRVGFLTLNGAPGKWNHFHRGLDIRLSPSVSHECGPLCGMHSLRPARARKLLRRYSPWSPTHSAQQGSPRRRSRELPPSLRGRRPFRLFFAGRSTRGGTRHELFRQHSGRPGFLLHDTSGKVWPASPATGRNSSVLLNTSRPDFLPRAMASSDFCLSPLGQMDGDSDRYLPAMLYGCVPVFTCDDEARPFDEVIDWEAFSIRLPRRASAAAHSAEDPVVGLHMLLDGISDERLLSMRRAMSRAWPRVLWSSGVAHERRAGLPAGGHHGLPAGGHHHGLPAQLRASQGAVSLSHSVEPADVARRAVQPSDGASLLGELPHEDAFATLLAVWRKRLALA